MVQGSSTGEAVQGSGTEEAVQEKRYRRSSVGEAGQRKQCKVSSTRKEECMEDYRFQLEEQARQVDELILLTEKRLNRSQKTEKQPIRISVCKNGFSIIEWMRTGGAFM